VILAIITSPKRQCAAEYHIFIIFAVFDVSVNTSIVVNTWLNCIFYIYLQPFWRYWALKIIGLRPWPF